MQGVLVTGIRFTDRGGVREEKMESAEEEKYTHLTIYKELTRYFEGRCKIFTNRFSQDGTAFQKKVWQAISEIPYGETRTYGEIAEMTGSPGASRAVGSACGKNGIVLLVPCHRVVSTSGIGGFSAGVEKKLFLLDLEQKR